MAEEEKQDGELEIEEGGKSNKMMIIIIAVVVLLAGGGAGAFFLMGGEEEPVAEETLDEESEMAEADAEGEPSDAEEPEPSGDLPTTGDALYVSMPRPFIFNVPGSSRDRLVQIKAQLMVRGAMNEEIAKKHIPLIEGSLTKIFASSNADDLGTSAGKEALRNKALKEVQDQMLAVEANKVIEKILFTGFVMQ